MTRICRFTAPASQDMERIMDYVADRISFEAAERLLAKINEKCQNLIKFPAMGRSRDELAPGMRSFPVNDYLIFYREIENGVEVVRVASGYQDLEQLFTQEN